MHLRTNFGASQSKSNYSSNFQLDMDFIQHIALLSFIMMVNETPELYLKASVFTVNILHAKG